MERSNVALAWLRWVGCVAILAHLATSTATAQRTDRGLADPTPYALLDQPSYFLAAWPRGALYEADVMLPANLYSRTLALRAFASQDVPIRSSGCLLPRGMKARDDLSRTATGCTLKLVPHFVLRQLAGGSTPVRTPTFNPFIEVTWYILSGVADAATSTPSLDDPINIVAVQARLGHYSNGQAGCLFAGQSEDSDGNCTPAATLADSLNRVDGSFAATYAELGLTYGTLTISREATEKVLATGTVTVRVYPGGWVAEAGGMGAELAQFYGRYTISARGDVRRRYIVPLGALSHRQVFNIVAAGECAPARLPPYSDCRGSAEMSIAFPGMYGLGFVARYVTGWDYYNVGFRDALKNPRHGAPIFGMILQHAAPTRFDIPWRR